jgi:hypothetical protein
VRFAHGDSQRGTLGKSAFGLSSDNQAVWSPSGGKRTAASRCYPALPTSSCALNVNSVTSTIS